MSFGVERDSELERRMRLENYELFKMIEKNRAEREIQQEERLVDIERHVWLRSNYTTGIHQQDTNYPLDENLPYPKKGKISSLLDPFDENRWGKDSMYYWMNRNGENNIPMVMMVEPPF